MKQCSIVPKQADLTGIETVTLDSAADFETARALATAEAERRFSESMLISWYDRDRDLESPPHTTEKPGGGPKDGYIHYAVSHQARLRVVFGNGRFVFFFTPVEW